VFDRDIWKEKGKDYPTVVATDWNFQQPWTAKFVFWGQLTTDHMQTQSFVSSTQQRQSSVMTLMCWSISRQSGAAADNLFPQHCEITCKNPMKVKTMLMIPYTSRCADVNNCTIRPYQTRSVTFRQQTPEALEVQKLLPSVQVAELVLISSDCTPSVDTM
jgi:hypothetical protein